MDNDGTVSLLLLFGVGMVAILTTHLAERLISLIDSRNSSLSDFVLQPVGIISDSSPNRD
jgi:hypothetical protein